MILFLPIPAIQQVAWICSETSAFPTIHNLPRGQNSQWRPALVCRGAGLPSPVRKGFGRIENAAAAACCCCRDPAIGSSQSQTALEHLSPAPSLQTQTVLCCDPLRIIGEEQPIEDRRIVREDRNDGRAGPCGVDPVVGNADVQIIGLGLESELPIGPRQREICRRDRT